MVEYKNSNLIHFFLYFLFRTYLRTKNLPKICDNISKNMLSMTPFILNLSVLKR